MESRRLANTDLMCNIIWLKVILAAKDVVRFLKIIDVLSGHAYGIYEVVNAVSIHLCGISSDIQDENNMN